MTDLAGHIDYPHEPGRLHDCPACLSRCHCTPGTTRCVYDGPDHKIFIQDLKVGQRIEMHPATDTWMRGDRYGEIVRISLKSGEFPTVTVELDRSGEKLPCPLDHIGKVLS